MPTNSYYLFDDLKEKQKYVVYTCITGHYDDPPLLNKIDNNFDYFFFTDNTTIHSDIWKIMPIPSFLDSYDNNRKCKYIKLHPHLFFKNYEVSLYMDGNLNYNFNMTDFVNQVIDSENYFFGKEHPQRTNIREETMKVIRMKKDNETILRNQYKAYIKDGFKDDICLIELGVIIRYHHDKRCVRLMEDWWMEIVRWSRRDQISFPYVLWKNKAKIKYFKGNDNFKARTHKGENKTTTKNQIKRTMAERTRTVNTNVYRKRFKKS